MSLSNYHKNIILRWINDKDTENKYREASNIIELTSNEKRVIYKNMQTSLHNQNVSKYYYQLQDDKWFDENKLDKRFKLSDEVLNLLYNYCNNRIIIFEVLLSKIIGYYSVYYKIDNTEDYKTYLYTVGLGFELYIYFRTNDYMLRFERKGRVPKLNTYIINKIDY